MKHKAVTAGAIGAAVSLIAAAPVAANHQGALLWPDGRWHEYLMLTEYEASGLACTNGVYETNTKTNVDMSPGDEDIRCHDGWYYGATWLGEYQCYDHNLFLQKCYAGDAHFNLYTGHLVVQPGQPGAGLARNIWKTVGCHEVGHSLSLGHRMPGEPSCMELGTNTSAPDNAPYFDSHDVVSIDTGWF